MLIRIVSISNCHLWDGKKMNEDDFASLIYILSLSGYAHTITYIDTDGKQKELMVD